MFAEKGGRPYLQLIVFVRGGGGCRFPFPSRKYESSGISFVLLSPLNAIRELAIVQGNF